MDALLGGTGPIISNETGEPGEADTGANSVNEEEFASLNGIEYTPHTDADWDPFSVLFKVL